MTRGMLTFNPHRWHVKVYRWWDRKYAWRKNQYWPCCPRPKTENLCHYMRVVLIWAPLQWFLLAKRSRLVRPWSVFLVVAVPIALSVWGVLMPDNFASFWITTGIATGILVGGCVLLLGGAWGFSSWRDHLEHRPLDDPSFSQVSWRYVKARKAKICPFIEIDDA